jgi:hypothetical protein
VLAFFQRQSALLEWQLQLPQVALGFDQHQRAFIDHDRGGALARNANRRWFGCNGRLHGGDFLRIRIDPLQAGTLCHLHQIGDRQLKRLDLG